MWTLHTIHSADKEMSNLHLVYEVLWRQHARALARLTSAGPARHRQA